ncbi:MAG: D-alanyl-D-alanine carboxypeptidase family protein [Pseudomonadota bacterium]
MLKRRFMLAATGSVLCLSRSGRLAAQGKPTDKTATLEAGNAETPVGPLPINAKWAYVLDHDTQTPLLDRNGTEPMPPSSMTKLMTLYIVYQRLKAGQLRLDQEVPVSEHAWRMRGSRMFVEVGKTVPVEDLIRGVIVQSGNDATVVLAEAVAGSEPAFVDLMNKEAQRIGLTASSFRNCTGWPDPEHHMSCRDIAVLAAHIISEFPEYQHYEREKAFKYNGINQRNRNPLVQKDMADGMKTGHTDAGGFGLCATAERDGRRVIVVLNGMPSSAVRASESERILNWSFQTFQNVTLFKAQDPIVHAEVWLGAEPTVPLVAAKDVVLTLPHDWRASTKVQVGYDAPIAAPVAAGSPAGRATISAKGMTTATIDLVTGADVDRLALPQRVLALISHQVETLVDGVIN